MGYFFDASKKLFGNARNGMKEVIANWNPEFATDLEIEQMEKEFDKINGEVTKAKQEMVREVNEYKTKKLQYDQVLSAAKLLNDQGKADKALALMDKAEAMTADIEREKQEADEATEYFNEMNAELTTFGKKITEAKQMLASKKREADMAKLKAEREDRKAQNARVLAGLKEKTSGLDSLANIYDKQKQEAESRADASKRKADVLKSAAGPKEEEDPDIAAAMAAASGKPAAPTGESFEERMARLKKL